MSGVNFNNCTVYIYNNHIPDISPELNGYNDINDNYSEQNYNFANVDNYIPGTRNENQSTNTTNPTPTTPINTDPLTDLTPPQIYMRASFIPNIIPRNNDISGNNIDISGNSFIDISGINLSNLSNSNLLGLVDNILNENLFNFVPNTPINPINRATNIGNLNNGTRLSIINQEFIDEEENTQCAICHSDFVLNDIVRKINSCNHFFHATCIEQWFASNNTCPVCRIRI